VTQLQQFFIGQKRVRLFLIFSSRNHLEIVYRPAPSQGTNIDILQAHHLVVLDFPQIPENGDLVIKLKQWLAFDKTGKWCLCA